jgi:hypothetical protein
MEIIVVLIITGAAATFFIRRSQKRRLFRARLHEAFLRELRSIGDFISRNFSVEACPQCHKVRMKFLEVSPNTCSLHYKCLNCRKKSRASAAPEAISDLDTRISALRQLVVSLNRISKPRQRIRDLSVLFLAHSTARPLKQGAGEAIIRTNTQH